MPHGDVYVSLLMNVVFTKVDFVIQNGLPAQLIARLSSTYV